jgi:hypothetical protein
MWKAIAVTAMLLVVILALSKLPNGRPGLDPKEELAFERQRAERLRVLTDQHTQFSPALACVAERSSAATAETLYLVWLNRRPDLVTVSESDAASQEVARQIAACGGDRASLATEAHRKGVDLEEAAALAMLISGR